MQTKRISRGIPRPYLYFDQFLKKMDHLHYRKPALCRVLEALPSVFYRALGKDGFAECFFRHSAKMALPLNHLHRVCFRCLGADHFIGRHNLRIQPQICQMKPRVKLKDQTIPVLFLSNIRIQVVRLCSCGETPLVVQCIMVVGNMVLH